MLRLVRMLCLLQSLLFVFSVSADEFCVIREPLGQAWQNELVTIPLSPEQLASLRNGDVLVGPDGRAIPHQMISSGKLPCVAFQLSLQPNETQAYRIVPAAAAGEPTAADRPTLVDEPDRILLGNSQIAVALLKSARGNQSPLAGFRLSSGELTLTPRLIDSASVSSSQLRTTARGPVFAEVVCEVDLSGGGRWVITCGVLANEPVVLIQETIKTESGGSLELPLSAPGFQPTHLLHRHGKGDLGRLDSWPLADGTAFLLEPWIRWWMNERQGNWFALHSETAEQMLMVAALKPSDWRQPTSSSSPSTPDQLLPEVHAGCENGQVKLRLPLGLGSRSWLVGCPPRAASVAVLTSNNLKTAPDCQQLVIRHGDFPFSDVRNWVLEWEGDHENHPRLFLSRDALSKLRPSLPRNAAEVRRWTSDQPIDKYNIEAPLLAWFATQDPQLEAALIARCEEWLETAIINGILRQHGQLAPGVAPHSQSVLLLPALNLADAVLSAPGLTLEQRRRILARIAFFGYAVSRDDYWSVSRGYAANPNMTTTVSLYRTLAASLVPSHPAAQEWAKVGLEELRRQLREWSDEDGGWLEAPHYAMVSLDHLVGAFVMARNNGFGNDLHDPRLKAVFEWLAQISTPADSRTAGVRHYPPIGHTYHGEGTGMFGIMAGLWQDVHPEFAGQMQWMYEQHGAQPIGLFGPFGTFSGYRSLLLAHGVKARPMLLNSRWFRDTGVVLRSHPGTDRETCLTLIAGHNHEHYDNDSGSITLWGQGRVLADDFGYVGAHPARFHSLPEWPGIEPTSGRPSVMTIQKFASGNRLDYVRGIRESWQREIAFLKDPAPAGSVGFLLHDRLEHDQAATWRLWLTGRKLEFPGPGRAVLIGEEDVDLEVHFWPTTIMPTSEIGEAQGMVRRNGREDRQTTLQTALTASLPPRTAVSAFLWPRRRNDPPPEVEWFADGRGVQVKSAAGIDYVCLPTSDAKSSPDERVRFRGDAAVLQKRGNMLHITQAGSGSVTGWQHTATSTAEVVTEQSVSQP